MPPPPKARDFITGERNAALILGALGDFILTLPLLGELQPRGFLALCTRGVYRALLPAALADLPFVDLDSAAAARMFADSSDLPEALEPCLRGTTVHAFMRPDLALVRNALRVGAVRLVWHDPRPSAPPHIVLRFFQEAGLEPPVDVLDTPVMPRREGAGQGLWLHAGSGSPAKTLPAAWLAETAQRQSARWGGRLVVSFGEADLAQLEPVRAAFRDRSLSFEALICPTLGELRRRLEAEAAAFIGADTGVTHLAAALGIPTTAVFRSTDPAIWRPVGRVTVQRGAAPCSTISRA